MQGFCELAANIIFKPLCFIIIQVKQLQTCIATGLILSALIFPVMRFGDTLGQFISQWGSYLNKVYLHICLNLAEFCCSRSGHLSTSNSFPQKEKQRQDICVNWYVFKWLQLNRCVPQQLHADDATQKVCFAKLGFSFLQLSDTDSLNRVYLEIKTQKQVDSYKCNSQHLAIYKYSFKN